MSGPFAVEAAIAALHCEAARAKDTDWPQIARLYDVLERLQPSPIVSLNRAVAVAMGAEPQRAAPRDGTKRRTNRARNTTFDKRRTGMSTETKWTPGALASDSMQGRDALCKCFPCERAV